VGDNVWKKEESVRYNMYDYPIMISDNESDWKKQVWLTFPEAEQ
jgi:hypothetical protein